MKQRASIARIEVPRAGGGGPIRGTGALVSADLVLTALHVVADRRQEPPVFYSESIQLTFPSITVKAVPVPELWNGGEDWVLLRCVPPPGLPPLPLGELSEDEAGLEWSTFGFPDAHPTGGMVFAGRLRDPEGSYEGVTALQLFCEDAAAGSGAPVAGLSGAPCLVEGAVVGVVRSSLLGPAPAHPALPPQRVNVAGTLYACPTRFVLDKAAALLPLPDPCRGLPGLPRRDLPATPYRALDWYREEDAELFFGRSNDLRELYLQLVDPRGAPITLFFGQSGVGKSSLLDAGLIPRLRATHAIHSLRRDATRGLRACLDQATDGDWLAREAREGRPLLVILDQVEEAFTRPLGDPYQELSALLEALGALFGPQAQRPRGRLLLAFRKEWLAELRERFKERGLSAFEYFLERLGREEIIEVVHGLRRTARLRQHYRVEIEKDLGVQIADDLLEDPGSPVAPLLQILMTRLWLQTTRESLGPPALTKARYLELKREGIHLEDFLRQALARLPPDVRPQVDSGLVDDLLEAHTTGLGTAGTRTRAELGARYAALGPEPLDRVLRALENEYLLTHPGRSLVEGDQQRTRLTHDTLAPLVRERFRTSALPGQRARRVLEARAAEWEDGRTGRTLDRLDLRLVEQGQAGMRAPTGTEQKLLRSSRSARTRETLGWALGVLGVVALIGLGAFLRAAQAERELRLVERQARAQEASDDFNASVSLEDPAEALVLVSRAVEVMPEEDPRWRLYVTRALHLFTRIAPVRARMSGAPLVSAEASRDWSRLLVQDSEHQLKVLDLEARDARSGVQWKRETKFPVDALSSAPRLSPDGQWVVTVSPWEDPNARPGEWMGGRFQLWDAGSAQPLIPGRVLEGRAAFSENSQVLLNSGFYVSRATVLARRGTSARWEYAPDTSWNVVPTIQAYQDAPQSFFLDSSRRGNQELATVIDIASGRPAFPEASAIPLQGSSGAGGRNALQVLLSPRGQALALVGKDKLGPSVLTWNTQTGRPIDRYWAPSRENAAVVAVSDDGQDLAVATTGSVLSGRDILTVLDDIFYVGRDPVARTGLSCMIQSPLARSLQVSRPRTAASRFKDGFVLACAGESQLQVWANLQSPPPLRAIDIQKAIAGQVDLEGGLALLISQNGWLEVHSLFEAVPEHVLERRPFEGGLSPAPQLTAARFSEDGSRLVILEWAYAPEKKEFHSRVSIREGPGWEPSWEAEQPRRLNRLVMTPDARHIAAIDSNYYQTSSLTLWDRQQGQRSRDIPYAKGTSLFDVGFDAEGRLLVGRSSKGQFFVDRFELEGEAQVIPVTPPAAPLSFVGEAWGLGVAGKYLFYRPSNASGVNSEPGFLLQELQTGKTLPLMRFDSGIGPPLVQTLLEGAREVDVRRSASGQTELTFTAGPGRVPTHVTRLEESTADISRGGRSFLLSKRPVNGPTAYCASEALFAYLHRPPFSEHEFPSRAQSTLHIESLATGTELAVFGHPTALDVRFTPDCEKLLTLSTDGVVREWFVNHTYSQKPAWVARLGALATGSRIVDRSGRREAVPELSSGPQRVAFLRELEDLSAHGDRGARYVLDHLQSLQKSP